MVFDFGVEERVRRLKREFMLMQFYEYIKELMMRTMNMAKALITVAVEALPEDE